MEALNINIERTGFPIKISGVEFFFDASVEGIELYEQNYQKAIDYINGLEGTGNTVSDRKLVLAKSYDILLGEGAFDQLYKKTPDVVALQNAFFTIVEGIASKVLEVVEEQAGKTQELMDEYELQDELIASNQR